MNPYESKRQSRMDRMRKRIETLRRIAATNDLSLFGEKRSGIPLGQPILVGHHSERRHRRHLERLHRLVSKGYEAGKMADRLEARLEAIERGSQIQVDNPDALDLLREKLKGLEEQRDNLKAANVAARKTGGERIPAYRLTNLGVEIRRLKKRIETLPQLQTGFEDYSIGDIEVRFVDGQIQVHFPYKPSEELRSKLKRSPLALKWSRYSGAWVRKWTDAVAGEYFQTTLKETLNG